MKLKIAEIIAIVITLLVLIPTPVAIFYHAPWKNHDNRRVIFLTAVANQGVWTEDRVNGLSCWNTNFEKATIVIHSGEEVILRFTSMDVRHTFFVPGLTIGPIVVEGGHVYDTLLKTEKIGEYMYYCTSVCGHCHYYMQGRFLVIDQGQDIAEAMKNSGIDTAARCHRDPVMEISGSAVEKGRALFRDKNCITCHGENGKGGIFNPNYAKNQVPRLNNLANTLKISWEEDADTIILLLEAGIPLDSLADDPPIENFNRFLAQYQSITNKIMDGASILQKADTTGVNPPLFMPSWEHHLTKEEINCLIAFLIDQQDWD